MKRTQEKIWEKSGFDEAGDWLAKLDRGLSSSEERQFQAWLFDHDDNYAVFSQLAQVWDRMDVLSRLAEIYPIEPVRKHSRSYLLPIAASLLMAAGVVYWMLPRQSIETLSETVARSHDLSIPDLYQTGIGQQKSVSLQDGTQLMLNTNSRVSVVYSANNRFLLLERGEMHVDVAHDPGRPLSVMAQGRIMQAVGTEFNVEITDVQNIELLVTEGVVMVGIVNSPMSDQVTSEPIVLAPDSSLITAGFQAVIDSTDDSEQSVEPAAVDTEEIAVKLSWREGNLIFRGERLEDAITEIGRYTAVEFVFLDEEAKTMRVAGLFKAGDVEGLLKTLRDNFNISYEWIADDKIALKGGSATH